MARPVRRSKRRFLVLGHRGSPGRATENSIESFRVALDADADGFETDLRLTKDGVIVLHHDSDAGSRPIRGMTLRELRRRDPAIATLDDLAPFVGKARMILEVKESGFERDLANAISGWPDVVVASFDHDVVERIASAGPIECGFTVRDRRPDLVARSASIGARWFFPRWNRVDQALVSEFAAKKIAVVPWTANRGTQWDRFLAWGCAGVMTDVPASAVRWRADRGAR